MTCRDLRCLERRATDQVRRLPGDVRDEHGEVVLVFAHCCWAHAHDSARCNREHYGHPAWVELREAVGWVCVVDLRPAIAALGGCGVT